MRKQPSAAVAPSDPTTAPRIYTFDGFAVDVAERALRHGGSAIQLPSRAFDLLVYLIRNRDRYIHKDELIAAIWNDVIVTDDSLIHAISVLRRTLGDQRHRPKYIQTIPRRGYRFVGTLRLDPPDRTAGDAPRADGAAAPAPIPAAEVSAPHRAAPKSRLGRPALAAALAGTAAVLIVIAALRYEPRARAPESTASIRLFQPAPPDASIVSGGVLSPDGRYLTFVAQDQARGQTALWLRALNSNELKRLAGTDGASKPFWSPDSARIGYFANGKLLAIDVHGEKPRPIATVFAAAGGSWGPDDTILFAEWNSGLFAVPASGDGTIRTVATLDRDARDIAFAWPQLFPDGHRFLYLINSLDAGRTGVYVGDLDTLESFKLLDTASFATLAPPHYLLHVKNDMLIAEELDPDRPELTGRAIVVARGIAEPSLAAENVVSASTDLLAFQHGLTRQSLAWFGRDGEALGAVAMPTVLYNSRISPDGSRLLGSSSLTTDPGLWLVKLDREEYSRLETDAIGPVWSPGGERVAFTSRGGYDLIVRSVGEPAERQMLASDDAVKILNDWTPDGRQLIYSRHEIPTGLDLWTIDVATGASRSLLETPHNETQARISPDGNWIAYASDETGVLETYVARFPGLDDRQQISVGGGGQPQWRSDQTELFYLSIDRAVMAVGVEGTESMTFGPPRQLFHASMAGDPSDARDYFAADAGGSRFLIDSAVKENDGQAITIMVNWSAGISDRQLDAARISQASR